MKKLLLAFSFTIAAFIAHAQNDNTLTIGIIGGANFASLQIQSPYKSSLNSSITTPGSLGLDADFKINDYFSIRPGLFYTGKGGDVNPAYVDANGNNVSLEDNYKLFYLEVPLNFIGHLPLGTEGANIFLGTGPYFAYGLNGTNQQTLGGDDTQKVGVSFGKNGDFKSTDVGASSVIGFQSNKGWAVSANIDLGLTNILQNNNTGFAATSIKTVTFYIGVAQYF